MAKGQRNSSDSELSNDEGMPNSNNLSTTPSTSSTASPMPSTSASGMVPTRRAAIRTKPYDANNSFVKKVATKVSDFIPQKSWISKWFNNSRDTEDLSGMEAENDNYDDRQSQPPLKRARIRMDVTHPPGTFTIKPREKKAPSQIESNREHFTNYNEITQDFSEPTRFDKVPRFVSSTPAITAGSSKLPESRSALNMLMTEQQIGATNGTDDNSESSESTSGCSSLIPQTSKQDGPPSVNYNSPFGKRKFNSDKFSFTNFLQSPRSLLLDGTSRETLASRQPSFNPALVNNSALERSSSLSSPFYSGNTMFGGANAAHLYRSNSVVSEPSQLRAPPRTNVQVNESSNDTSKIDLAGMSTTARRILDTIEQFSSPLTDARKIPVRDVMNVSRNSSSSSLLNNTTLNMSRKREREEDTPRVGYRHLTRELMVPTVPDMLRLRRRQRLQNTTMNARKIASARNATAAQKYQMRSETEAGSRRNHNNNNVNSNTNPLKAKKNLEEEETVEPVNLPTIALPISNLPRFDIALPTKPASTVAPEIRQTPKPNKADESFKFASPIKLPSETKNLEPIDNFTFSEPMSPSKASSTLNESMELSKTLSVDSTDSASASGLFPNFVWNGPSQSTLKPKEKAKPKEEEPSSKGLKVASELKTGSVMDFFAKSSKPVIDTTDLWECNECLIKNSSKETHCVACKSSKAKDSDDDVICLDDDDSSEPEIISESDNKLSKTSTKIFGSSVSPNPSSSIFGNFDSIKQSQSTKMTELNSSTAMSCELSKSESTLKTSNLASNTLSTTISASSSTLSSTLTGFKPNKSSWECPCCMVQNADTATTCPCCNTAKPGSTRASPKRTLKSTLSVTASTTGFGDKFKKPEGSWTCDTCMIQNKSDVVKCAACETPKPGAAKGSSVSNASSLLSSGSSTATSAFVTANSFGDKFKKPEGSWTCDTCMIQNKSDLTKCAACETPKPGAAIEAPKSSSQPKLQINVDIPANAGSFKFGIDKASEGSDKASNSAANASLPKTNGFTFGSSASSTSAPVTGFSFGMPSASTDKDNNKPATSSSSTSSGDASKSITGGFAFKPPNGESSTAAATFQFGAKPDKEVAKEENKSTTTATFTFGATAKTEVKAPADNFVFGSPKSASSDKNKEENKSKEEPKSTSSALFTFGASAGSNAKSDEKSQPTNATPATSSFVFGSSKPTFSFQSKVEETSKSSSLAATTASGAETPKTAEPTKTTATSTGFSFGSSSNTPASGSSLFTFGAQAKTTSETTATTATTASLPAFGSSNAPKPTFSFGKPAESTPTSTPPTSQKVETPVFTFGSPATQTPNSAFGQTNQTTSSNLFGAPENKTAPFGEPDAKTRAFGTGSTSTVSKPAAGASIFGAPATATSNVASPFGSGSSVFGSGSTPSFATNATPNVFGPAKTSETTPAATPGLFSFGQSSQTTAAPASSGFNFNAGSKPATATVGSNGSGATGEQKSLFSFGASNGNTAVNSFAGSSTFSAAPAATPNFTFNAPKPDASATVASPFGGAATPSPMFNAPSAATPSAQTPNFGTGTPSSAPASGGFNFGSAAVPNNFSFSSSSGSSSTGFNFNAPGTSAPPAFDPTAAPTFNFTAGSGAPTTFNATPARKIKKAVRRMPRQ